MNSEKFITDFIDFLRKSPTSFHAVKNTKDILEKAGFEQLEETTKWELKPGGKYMVTRNGSAIIAFITGKQHPEISGIRLAGAHTDSPCLKIKPVPEIKSAGYIELDVEIYGGVLLNTWFDRDLSIAGRITCLMEDGKTKSCLIDLKDPVAFIPSLAIHLYRDVNNSKSVNSQKEMLPLLMLNNNGAGSALNSLLLDISKKQIPAAAEILDHELFLYDVQPPSITGLNKEFITGARIDNLLSCYAGVMAIAESETDQCSVLVLNDNEEVGSLSTSGADGQFLKSVLERICGTGETFSRVMAQSIMMSTDNAHGIHPNYTEKHDTNHRPLMNMGPAVKINASQRYATSSESSAFIRLIAKRNDIPLQTFTMRSDMACGSTIGPITAAMLGIKTVDIGVPTLGMHSIREIAGTLDIFRLYSLIKGFYSSEL